LQVREQVLSSDLGYAVSSVAGSFAPLEKKGKAQGFNDFF
jgi:hypothetical protein